MHKDKGKDDQLQARSARFLSLWGVPELASRMDIQFSRRLRMTLGRTQAGARKIRLNAVLADGEDALLDEVICHELAHIVVHERFGAAARPHGPQWADLMRQAGFEPRLAAGAGGTGATRSAGQRFEHLCPVCQAVRYAKRPMTRWRCGSCVDAGLGGRLLIRRVGGK